LKLKEQYLKPIGKKEYIIPKIIDIASLSTKYSDID
jgi:hypothetical protein